MVHDSGHESTAADARPPSERARKPLYFSLAAASLVAAVVLMVMALDAWGEYEQRRRLADRLASPAQGSGPANNSPLLVSAVKREREAAAHAASGARSMMIGLFAAALGAVMVGTGFVLAAYRKPKQAGPWKCGPGRHRA